MISQLLLKESSQNRTVSLLWKWLVNIIYVIFRNECYILTQIDISLSKCQQTSHYPVIKMSTNISLSVYHNVNEHLTIRLSKCPRTYHYHYDVVLTNKWDLINISLMDILTDCNEHLTMRLSKCPRTFHYPSIKMSMNISLSVYQPLTCW
jgi:hypothetical protein